MAAPAGYTAVSSAHLSDATGALITNATISFQPVTSTGFVTSFHAGGSGGAVISSPVEVAVANGAFTINLADTSLTQPANIGYRVTVTDNVTGKSLLGPGYSCIQPFGPAWSLDDYQTNAASVLTIQTGPRGPQGQANTLSIGAVTSGDVPSASLTGTSPNQVLNLVLVKGDQGDVSRAQLLSATFPMDSTRQLFDRTAVTNNVQTITGGGLSTRSGCRVSDFIPTGENQWVANQQLVGGSTGFGTACYGINREASFIDFQSPSANIEAGTVVTPLPGTVYTRLMYFISSPNPIGSAAVDDTSLMVNFGTTVSSWKPFGAPTRADIPSDDHISDIAALVVSGALDAEAGISRNRVLSWTQGALQPNDVVDNTHGASNFYTDYIPINEPLIANGPIFGQAANYGVNFYDGNKVKRRTLFGDSSTGIAVPAGMQIVPQSGERYIRFTVMLAGNAAGATPIASLATFALTGGSSVPAYSDGGIVTVAKGKQLFAQNFIAGKKWGLFGDSYSGRNSFNRAWQNVVTQRTGMTFAFQDAIAGRRWLHDSTNPSGGTIHGIFSHYGGGNGSGTCDTGTVYGAANNNDEDTFGCAVGQTLAQVLAPLDVLVIELGTNELNTADGGNTPLGTQADAAGTDTVYGAVKNALSTIVAAKNDLTVVVVGPAWTTYGTFASIQANDQAIEYCCNLYSVPYLSMFRQLGMNDINRSAISDGVHPSVAYFQKRYGPMVADFVQRYV